jgi:hypothetical protein
MAKNIAQLMVDTLVHAGVERVYGLPGDSLNGFTDSIRKQKKLQWIQSSSSSCASNRRNILPPYQFGGRHVDLSQSSPIFDQDSNVDNDISAVRKLRMEVVMIPWLVLTSLLVILLINLWRD